jgi:hypothetical protein
MPGSALAETLRAAGARVHPGRARGAVHGPPHAGGGARAYAQALSLVEHLVRVRGEGAVACLVVGSPLRRASTRRSARRRDSARGAAPGVEAGGGDLTRSDILAIANTSVRRVYFERLSFRNPTHAGSAAIGRYAGSARRAARSRPPAASSARSAATAPAASPVRAWICARSSARRVPSGTRSAAWSMVLTAAAAPPRFVCATAERGERVGVGPGGGEVLLEQRPRLVGPSPRERDQRELPRGSGRGRLRRQGTAKLVLGRREIAAGAGKGAESGRGSVRPAPPRPSLAARRRARARDGRRPRRRSPPSRSRATAPPAAGSARTPRSAPGESRGRRRR